MADCVIPHVSLIDHVAEFIEHNFFLFSEGNATHERGSSYDANARAAPLHAPARDDATSWDGPWGDAPWCHASGWDDARANAPRPGMDHVCLLVLVYILSAPFLLTKQRVCLVESCEFV